MKEPWEEYPHIFETKSAFFTFLRGKLRQALWNRWPGKIEFKKEMAFLPPEGYTGRAKKLGKCALTGEVDAISKMQVDHIVGNVSLRDWEDVLPFILHLCASKENMQLVAVEAHKIKSFAEKKGISFEQAVIEKEAIAICKAKQDVDWLKERGIKPDKNGLKRRGQIIKALMEEKENE